MCRPHTVVTLLLFFFVLKSPVLAAEWLSGNELEESCDSFLEDPGNRMGTLCLAFMQGFLAASEVEGEVGVAPQAEGSSGSESFSERAARTRLGTLRMMQIRDSDTPEYCLDDDISAVEVVESVARYLRDHPEALQLTNAEAVRESLIHNYPCER